jgi:hypothetical protein
MKKDGFGFTELLNSPELLVGVVEATVMADLGLKEVTMLSTFFSFIT